MTSKPQNLTEGNRKSWGSDGYAVDYRSLGPASIAEPITPPASNQSHLMYSSPPFYANAKQAANLGPSQFSPNGLLLRDNQSGSGHNTSNGFNSAGTFLGSPVEPMYPVYTNTQSQVHLGTPQTPLLTSGLGTTPSMTRNGVSRGHQNRQSVSMGNTQSQTQHSNQQTQHYSGHQHSHSATQLQSAMANAPAYGHTRSYSHNIVDPQTGMSRMSLSGAQTGAILEPRRPRAYSQGLSAVITSRNTTSNTFGSSDSVSQAFPAPLSSPISPGNFSSSGSNRLSSHRPYSHAFSSANDEISTSPSSLYRSMSTTSMNNGSNVGPRAKRGSSGSSLNCFGKPLVTQVAPGLSENESVFYGNSGGSTVGSVVTMGAESDAASIYSVRRSSPPQSARPFSVRRSSSSASSVDLTGSNAGVSPGLVIAGSTHFGMHNTSLGVEKPNVPIPMVDLENSTDEELYSLCKDQRGCRFLQRKLAESGSGAVHRVFEATSPHIVALMVDPFGNYFCQKLFEQCDAAEITEILGVAAPSLATIAINQHGTRALQRLIESVSQPEQVTLIVNALDGHVVRLIRDINGNHVIQKLLLSLSEDGSQFIYDAVCESVIEIGSHRHGCCVLQRCLDYAKDENRKKLVNSIVKQSLTLVCDPFGNYVCQYVLDLGNQEFTDSLVRQLLGKISALSVQKFSSNVVEKCLRASSEPLRREVVAELMVPRTLNELLLDNYGNYVIQTALESMTSLSPEEKQELSGSIYNALAATRSPYGRRIMSKLKAW